MTLRRLLPIFPLAVSLAISAPAQTSSKDSPQDVVAAPAAYPDSPEGLRQLIQDVVTATRAGDDPKVSSLLKSLIIPNSPAWFAKVFGPERGANLAGTYGYHLTEGQERLREFLAQLAEKKGELVIERVKESQEPGEGYVAQAIRQSIKEPVIFYSVSWRSSFSSPGLSIGYFTFIDGGFRRIDVGVLHILDAFKSAAEVRAGTTTPKRIRVGGMVMRAKLINKVPPRYPVEAKKRGIQDTVRVQVLVDKEGIVRDVELISGDPLLAEAAVRAVRQWRYQATLLNGEPVEVETTIDVVFTLSP